MLSTELADATETITDGGVAGTHPQQIIQPVLFGPATGGEFNTVREDLAPVACLRLDNVRFEFDSSFPGPKLSAEMRLLAALRRQRTGTLASVFGHADPVGSEDYNKKLGGRRAQAIYALLTRKTELWEDLYKNDLPNGGDAWGPRTVQTMLASLGHYDGPVDGKTTPETKEAVKSFQGGPAGAGLKADGDPGPKTRAQLYQAYMDLICATDDDVPFRMDPATDFLGRGADAGGKADYQGCGEINPSMIFSLDESKKYEKAGDKTERDKENEQNRRVLIFLFRPNTTIGVEQWPCPRAKEGPGACKKRLWSDADLRRTPAAERRFFDQTADTFACRFYHRLAVDSVCERPTSARADLDVYIHAPVGAEEFPEAYRLESSDGVYRQELARADAVPHRENMLALRYTKAPPNKHYSLYQCFTPTTVVPVFLNVPYASISDHGQDTPPPPPRPAPPAVDERPLALATEDAADDQFHHPSWYIDEPHKPLEADNV